jgi:hypothetical protein
LTKENITRQAAKIMRIYNEEQPHDSLGNKTPKSFEEMIEKMNEAERPKVKVYEWKTTKALRRGLGFLSFFLP